MAGRQSSVSEQVPQRLANYLMATVQESALVVLVPEADLVVKPYRDQFDPSAAAGVPAHITILYPFKPPAVMTAAIHTRLDHIFSRHWAFPFSLVELRRFPTVLYLAPLPDAPFKSLTQAVVDQFPDTPPYGGAFSEVVPHLTIAQVDDPGQLDRIADDFQQSAGRLLPIRAAVAEVACMDNLSGTWQVSHRCRLQSG